jgi:hypothetical protein
MVTTLLTTTELSRFHFGNLSCKTLLLSCHRTSINYLCKLVSTICKWLGAVSGYCVGSRILWCSESGDYPENNLAKLGYILDMKVEKKQKAFYIFGYLLKLIIKKLGNLGHFSLKNPFYWLKSYFSSWFLAKFGVVEFILCTLCFCHSTMCLLSG